MIATRVFSGRGAAVAAAACVFALASSAASAAPMFVNGDFETGDFTGWTVGGRAVRGGPTAGAGSPGTEVAGNTVQPHAGNFAAFANLQTNAPATTLTLEQTLTDFVPGQSYQVTYW